MDIARQLHIYYFRNQDISLPQPENILGLEEELNSRRARLLSTEDNGLGLYRYITKRPLLATVVNEQSESLQEQQQQYCAII